MSETDNRLSLPATRDPFGGPNDLMPAIRQPKDKLLDVEAFSAGKAQWATNLMHGTHEDKELLMKAKGTNVDFSFFNATPGSGAPQIDGEWHPIRGYLCHKASKTDRETGELIEFPRLALVLGDGKVVELFPRYAVQDLVFAAMCYGPGPWDDIDVQVARVPGNNPVPACRLNFRERPKAAVGKQPKAK